jgi:hypothetical protein
MAEASEPLEDVPGVAPASVGDGRKMLPSDAALEAKVNYIMGTPVFTNFNPRTDPMNNLIMRCETMLLKAPGVLTQNTVYRQKIAGYCEVSYHFIFYLPANTPIAHMFCASIGLPHSEKDRIR